MTRTQFDRRQVPEVFDAAVQKAGGVRCIPNSDCDARRLC